MSLSKTRSAPLAGWLAKGAVALFVAFIVTGCVVEERPYHPYWHGYHEWR